MRKSLFLFFILTALAHEISFAQFSRYIIRLKDKVGTPFSINNPSGFLTQRSIDRRVRYSISIEETDLPINPAYIDSIINTAPDVTILNTSKWLNQVCILTTNAVALAKINSFSFVMSSNPVALRMQTGKSTKKIVGTPVQNGAASRPLNPADYFNYGLSYQQIHLHNGEFLHNLGFRGEGLQMALMDDGFYHYKSLPTFDSVKTNNQVLGTWDFVAGDANVDEDDSHGMECFSTISANLPGSFVGSAPKSNFYLYRTEDAFTEYPVEEQNWAAAAERADSLGVDIFSVSLGYTTFDNSLFDYTYSNMDGNTTMMTRAADLAAKKGILVVVAAGNTGNNSWHYISAPADADSVLSVGAVNINRQVAGFSSYGPTSDGRIKPDVAAVGLSAVVADPNTGEPAFNNGTSFACPIMAGIAGCLWQAFPEVNNMTIIEELRKSSDKSSMPDDRTGYGIPDVKKAFVSLVKKRYTQQVSIDNNCKTNITGNVKAGINMNVEIERKLPADIAYSTIHTQQFNGSFVPGSFGYADDLSAISSPSTIQYRVKMNIGTDTSFYLDSASVNYTRSCNNPITERITISPNPVKDNVTILIARANTVTASIVIYSGVGQQLYNNTRTFNGVQTITVPMSRVGRGIYYVKIIIDGKREMVKKIIRD